MAISSFLTALGWTFYAQYFAYIDPTITFGPSVSIQGLLQAIVGGAGTVLGPVIGAFVLTPVSELSRAAIDRKSTRLNSSHTVISPFSLHDALPIYGDLLVPHRARLDVLCAVLRLHRSHDYLRPVGVDPGIVAGDRRRGRHGPGAGDRRLRVDAGVRALPRGHRSEEHTSELQSHSDLPLFPTRRSSDLWRSPRSSPRSAGRSMRSTSPTSIPRLPSARRCRSRDCCRRSSEGPARSWGR